MLDGSYSHSPPREKERRPESRRILDGSYSHFPPREKERRPED
jgi:hypothetical protein